MSRNGVVLDLPESVRAARRPFAFNPEAREVGVLCLHGFTGSPAELRPLGAFLAEHGFAVEAPLLPQHGGMPHELKGARRKAWLDAAARAFEVLQQRCRDVFIAGLSMGGLLALHFAAQHATPKLRGLIVMAAPAAINDPRARFVGIARFFVPYHYPFKGINFDDPAVRAEIEKRFAAFGRIDLDDPQTRRAIVNSVRIPVDAIHELIQLNAEVMRLLPAVRAPVLFLQGRRDRVIQPDSAEVLAARVGSTYRRVIWYENSAHELPLEPDAPRMFADILAFIREHSLVQAPEPAPAT